MRFFLLFICFVAHSQDYTKKIGSFDSLKVLDGLNITLIPSAADSIRVTGHNAEFLTSINKNGVLKLRLKTIKKFSGFRTNIEIFFSQPLESIEAKQGSFISSSAVLTQSSIELRALEGAEISLTLESQKVTSRSSTGSTITLDGSTVTHDAYVGIGGSIDAEDLSTEQTHVKSRTGGQANVQASELLEAYAHTGGLIRVYGTPAKTVQTHLLGGSITTFTTDE